MALSITKELESTLGLAFAEAKARRHEHVTLEHLLYALLRDPVAARILRACGARLPELRRELEQHLDESQPSLPRGADREPEHTQAFKRVLERAALQVQSSGKEQIDGGNVLVAFYRERDSHAVYLLERQGITRLDLLRYISHGALKVRDPSAMAVFPTPDSPTKIGLFLRRRQRTWIVRSSSRARPMRGSIAPAAARSTRFAVKAERGSRAGGPLSSSSSAASSPLGAASSGTLEMPCDR